MTTTRRDVLISGGAIAAGSTFTVRAEQRVGSGIEAGKADGIVEPLCLTDFEPLAKAKIPSMGWEYMTAGAADELTLKWNTEAYQRIRLRPNSRRRLASGHKHSFARAAAPGSHPAGSCCQP